MDPAAAAPLLLTRLPEDALVTVFKFLPPVTHSILCCVCQDWYRYSSYTDTCAALLSRRVRYWLDWTIAQPAAQQTLAHLLAAHPILASAQAHSESVQLNKHEHPTAMERGTNAAGSAAASSSPSRRVTIQTAQLLNLVEILCSAFRGRSVRNTSESHLSPLGPQLLQPLESFALEALDLSGLACVDSPVMRALARLPALHTLSVSNCRMLTDAGVRAILHPEEGLRSLTSLDLAGNTQLKGAWFEGPGGGSIDDAEASSAGELGSSSASLPSRPSLLRVLILRGCTSLVGRHFDFSPRTLGSLVELDASRTSASLALLLVQHLHLCSSLHRLDLSHNRWTASPQLSYLVRRGRFRSEQDQFTVKALNDSIAALISRGDPVDAPFPPPTTFSSDEAPLDGLVPLGELSALHLSHMVGLPDCILTYLLLHCSNGVLRELDVAGCESLTATQLSLACAAVGAGLRRLNLSGLAMTEAAWSQLQTGVSPMLQLQEWNMDGLSIGGCSAATMWGAIASAAPNLQALDVSRLQMPEGPPAAAAAAHEDEPAGDDSVAALAARLARETLAARTAAEWNAAQEREAREARDRLRNHARQMGLPLPPEDVEAAEGADSSSSASSTAAAAAPAASSADSASASSSLPPPSLPAVGFTSAFASALHRLRALRVLRACGNPMLMDDDLDAWSEISTQRPQPQEEEDKLTLASAGASSLEEMDLSGCERISTRAVTDLIRARLPTMADSSSSSSTASSSVSAPFVVRVDDCPGVDAAAIPLPWRMHVQQAEPFSL